MADQTDEQRLLEELVAENRRLRKSIDALGRSAGTAVMVVEIETLTDNHLQLVVCFPQGSEKDVAREIARCLGADVKDDDLREMGSPRVKERTDA